MKANLIDLSDLVEFAFMGKFLQLIRFVQTMTLDQPTFLYDLNPQLG